LARATHVDHSLPELIGWSSSLVLLITLCRQVYKQWRSGATSGLSRWLFAGQLVASIGFAVYSWMLGNWVFLVTNVLILTTALVGETIYVRNRRRAATEWMNW
jgi:MtN3 and saliva related transmembrane protein